jgi:ankyrin repeat protein
MRTLLLVSLVFAVVACSSAPPTRLSPAPAGAPVSAAPTHSEPTPAPTNVPVSTSATAAGDACPALTHAEQPPVWTGTPLHAAIYAKDLKQVQLLAVDPALHQLDSFEATALLAAVSPSVPEPTEPPKTAATLKTEDEAQIDIVRELLKRGADVNQSGYQGITPLNKVAKMGYSDSHLRQLLTLLLQAKADIDARDARGRTALMAAARADRATVVELLIARGANTTLTDCAGQTALDVARSANAGASIEVLTRTR